MDETAILKQLEELAESLGITVRYETIKKEGTFYPGGLCRIKGDYVVIINSMATTRDKIEAFARAVNRFDLNQVYLKPGLRDFLQRFFEE
ncbi:MAG: hypothetical protein ABIG67_11185 [Pseudomonadota bacterium]